MAGTSEDQAAARAGSNGDASTSQAAHPAENGVDPGDGDVPAGAANGGLTVRVQLPDEPEQDAAAAHAAEEGHAEAGVQPEAGVMDGGGGGERQQGSALSSALGSTRTAQLASLAEQADLRGLEKALDAIEAERNAQAGAEAAAAARAAGVPVRGSFPRSFAWHAALSALLAARFPQALHGNSSAGLHITSRRCTRHAYWSW